LLLLRGRLRTARLLGLLDRHLQDLGVVRR
jgi:hypothetical protein